MTSSTQLKTLLTQRHWQVYRTFCQEYDRAAKEIDESLIMTYPSRATFQRWLAGDVRTKPYPDACRVLERMFPGWSADDLFSPPNDKVALTSKGTGPNTLVPGVSPADQTLQAPPAALAYVRERRLVVDIDVAPDGAIVLNYEHEIENTSTAPYTRLVRDLWFAISSGPLTVEALPDQDRQFIVKRIHEAPAHLTYACQFVPALATNERASVRYLCTGARFGAEHYWRQAILSPVDEYTLRVRLRGVQKLTECTAIEERADGAELSAGDTLSLVHEGEDLVLTLTRTNLEPNQFVTLRWDFPRAAAG